MITARPPIVARPVRIRNGATPPGTATIRPSGLRTSAALCGTGSRRASAVRKIASPSVSSTFSHGLSSCHSSLSNQLSEPLRPVCAMSAAQRKSLRSRSSRPRDALRASRV